MNKKTVSVPGALLIAMAAALTLSFVPLKPVPVVSGADTDIVSVVIAESNALGQWRSGPRALIAASVNPAEIAGYGLAQTTFEAAELPLSLVLLKGDFVPGQQLPSATMPAARYLLVVYSRSQRRPVLVSMSSDGARLRRLFDAAGLTP